VKTEVTLGRSKSKTSKKSKKFKLVFLGGKFRFIY